MRYNKANFKKFLKQNLKTDIYNFEAYCQDLEIQYGNTGIREYELSKFETKSGNTELFRY